MIFTPMSVVDLKKLHQKIQKPIFVRFPKNNKQTFLFNNIQYCHKYKGIILYNEYKTVETNVEEFLYILAFSCVTGFVTALLYPDSALWEPDIIIIMVVVFLIDFVWFTTYLLRST